MGVVDNIVDAAMEEYHQSGERSIPETESQRLHVTGQMIMRTELRMENLMQEIQDMLQQNTEIQHSLRDHNKKKPKQESMVENEEVAEKNEGEQTTKHPAGESAQPSSSNILSSQSNNREDDLSAHAVEEKLRTVREQIKQVEKQEQILQTTLHKLFKHPLFEVASEALNPHSGMAAFTGGGVLSRRSYHEDKNEPQPTSAASLSRQPDEPQQDTGEAEQETDRTEDTQQPATVQDGSQEKELSARNDSTTVVKSVQDLEERLQALEKTVRQIQAAEQLIGITGGSSSS